MFRCQVTGRLSNPGDKCHKIVTHRREKHYKRDGEVIAVGWEVAREINATDEGLRIWNATNPHVIVLPAE